MATVTNFYLGANSGEGFQNLFQQLTDRTDTYDLMILKGGPGVGKSAFMAQIGLAMEKAGEQVEYIRCSGNPDTLDGVVLPGMRCAIADGTEPHVLEPRYPAAVDRYVDLGRFYDLTAAKAAQAEIIALTERQRAARCRAYHCLQAARQLELETLSAVQGTFDRTRADRRLDGVLARELRRRGSEEGRTDYRFLGSITCKGYDWRFDAVDTLCPKVYEFADHWELAGDLLERLRHTAVEKGWNVIACPSPEDPRRLEHLLIPGLGLAFITSRPGMDYGKKPYRRIRLDAMVRPEGKAKLRFEGRMTALLRDEAAEALRAAKSARDELEAIHKPYVNSDSVRALAAVEIGRLLSWRDRR